MKRVLTLFLIFVIAFSVMNFSACSSNGSDKPTGSDEPTQSEHLAYDMYASYAQERGTIPLAYSDWASVIKREDGYVPEVTVSEGGCWVIDEKVTTVSAMGKFGPTATITKTENGNWKINGSDTGIASNGKDVSSVTAVIGRNGHWYIGETDTNVSAMNSSNKGTVALNVGDNGNWFIGGKDTGFVANSKKPSGSNISISEEGNWVIDGVDTGINAGGSDFVPDEYESWKDSANAVDNNENGKIDYEDYLIYIISLNKEYVDVIKWRSTGKAYDANNDGRISIDDYKTYLATEAFIGNFKIVDFNYEGRNLSFFDRKLSLKKIKDHISDVNFNVGFDGKITYQIKNREFSNLVKEHKDVIDNTFDSLRFEKGSSLVSILSGKFNESRKYNFDVVFYLQKISATEYTTTTHVEYNNLASDISFTIIYE